MFASELIGDPVVDRVQENIGRVKDIIITLGETFPRVTGLLITTGDEKKEHKVLLIGEIDLIGRQFVSTRTTKDRVPLTSLREGEVLLSRDVMDQQVVDLDGARVIRVNDLKLAKVDQAVRLIAADVGLSGMLRRLGLESFVAGFFRLFRRTIPEQLIGWDHVQDLSGGKIAIPTKSITNLHPADVAQIISQVQAEQKTAIFSALSEKTAAEALHELEPMIGAVLISTLDTKKALGVLEKMPIDEAADIIGDVPVEKAEELLRLMRPRRSVEVRKLLKHRDETAGGLMTTEFIALQQNMTVEQGINYLRGTGPGAGIGCRPRLVGVDLFVRKARDDLAHQLLADRVAKQIRARPRDKRGVLELIRPGADQTVPVDVCRQHQAVRLRALCHQQAFIPGHPRATLLQLALQHTEKRMLRPHHTGTADQLRKQVEK